MSVKTFRTAIVSLSKIRHNGRLRSVNNEVAGDIAESIRENGLINPIILSCDYFLLGGNHRFAAAQKAKLKKIECRIAPYRNESEEAKLLAIDDNLMRRELTTLERAEFLRMREEILLVKGRRTLPGRRANESEPSSAPQYTTADLGKEIGLGNRQTMQYLRIAKSLTNRQRNKIRHTSLANHTTHLIELSRIQDSKRRDAAITKLLSDKPPVSVKDAVRQHRIEIGEIEAGADIIKPSNWWAFGRPKYQQENGFGGSIPGDVYANALYYFAPLKGIAVDGMAGSGMLRRVYDDRKRWQKDLGFHLTIQLFDLHPRPSIAKRYNIKRHDMMKALPIKADWLFIDPPYFGIASKLYKGELAETKDYKSYLAAMAKIIHAAWESLNTLGVLCLLATPFIDVTKPDQASYDVPADLRELALTQGFHSESRVYISRGEQQRPWAGQTNLKAKRVRRPFSDVCELLVLRKRNTNE